VLVQNHRLLQVLLLHLLTHSLQSAPLPHRLLLAQILVLLLQLPNRSVQVALVLVVLKDLQSQAQTKTLYHPQKLQPRSSTHPLSSHSLIQQHRRLWLNLIPLTS
jgi:hypothetical protein